MLTEVKTFLIYMKSGNVIKIDKVNDLEIIYDGNIIKTLSLSQSTRSKE